MVYGTPEYYLSVLPFPVQGKWGLKRIPRPWFCQQLGVFGFQNLPPNLHKNFLSAFLESADFIDNYPFNASNFRDREFKKAFSELFSENINARILTCTNYIIDFSKPPEVLYKALRKDRKDRLRQAEKKGIHIYQSQDIGSLIDLFRKYTASKIDGGVSEAAYEVLENLSSSLFREKRAEIWYAEKKQTIIAGCFLAFHSKGIVYLFNAASPEGRKSHARDLILHQIRERHAMATKPFFFDFESPEAESVAAYYKSFGSEKEHFFRLSINSLPRSIESLRRLRAKLRGRKLDF